MGQYGTIWDMICIVLWTFWRFWHGAVFCKFRATGIFYLLSYKNWTLENKVLLCIICSVCGDNGVVGDVTNVEVLERDVNWPNTDDILCPICINLLKNNFWKIQCNAGILYNTVLYSTYSVLPRIKKLQMSGFFFLYVLYGKNKKSIKVHFSPIFC